MGNITPLQAARESNFEKGFGEKGIVDSRGIRRARKSMVPPQNVVHAVKNKNGSRGRDFPNLLSRAACGVPPPPIDPKILKCHPDPADRAQAHFGREAGSAIPPLPHRCEDF